METLREPPVVLESKPLENPEEVESRRLMEENIISALNDKNIIRIGIDGAVGIGKSKMVRRISEKVKREKLFKVVMVTVGPSSDLNQVVGDYVARANEILSRLIVKERVLIILDDVREILNLEKIEPLEKLNGSYKIIITSRFKSVCLAMGCDLIFTVREWTLKKYALGRSGAPRYSRLLPVFVAGENLQKKIVVRFPMNDRSKALKISSGISGVESRSEKDQLVVVGSNDIDAVVLVQQLRKNLGYSEIVSVSEDKKEAPAAPKVKVLIPQTAVVGSYAPPYNWDPCYTVREMTVPPSQNTMTEEVVVDSPDFTLFCSMFPSDYEFTRDILVWQWIAGGLTDDETMENACLERFDTLLSMDYIVPSGYDHLVDQTKYKFGDKMISFLQEQQLEPTFRKHLDSHVAQVQHLSLAFEQSDGIEFEALKRYSHLQSLVINHCYGSKVKYLPSDLFLELKDLKILNLSRTGIVALPSSVENLKELRFLDVSETPISWLPETIRCFSSLQTLKLDGCLSLRRLPKCTNELINLRQLVLDVARQLQSMPVGIGKLSKLQTLTAYLVGEDDGCRIGELKDMNKLRGSLRVMNLENVETKEEAEEACLFNKLGLKKLELQWSDLQDEKHTVEEGVLESLEPPFGIHQLKILFYSGGVFPSWISNPPLSV